MKYKMILLLSIVAFSIGGLSSMKKLLPEVKSYQELSVLIVQQASDVAFARADVQESIDRMGGRELGTFASNVDIANEVCGFEGGKVVSVSALKKDSSGALENVLTITNAEEVSYFTDTIDEMSFDIEVTDLDQLLDAVADSDVCFNSVWYSKEENTLTVIAATVSSENGTPVNIDSPVNSESISGESNDSSGNDLVIPDTQQPLEGVGITVTDEFGSSEITKNDFTKEGAN